MTAVGAGAFVGWAFRRKKVQASPVLAGAALQLVEPNGNRYRARLIRPDGEDWTISAPTHRGVFVPLRVDQSLVVEAPSAAGVHRVQARVVARDLESRQFSLALEGAPRLEERRQDRRWSLSAPIRVRAAGQAGQIINLGSGGARLIARTEVEAGDSLSIQFGAEDSERQAWVLEVLPAQLGSYRAQELRVLWLEPLPASRLRALVG